MPTRSVTVLDYGVGNLRSVVRAFEECGATVTLAETPKQAAAANRLVVPGVGAFHSCVSALDEAGFRAVVDEAIDRRDRPVLGICVGMQMLFDSSEEFGDHAGLGYLPGNVRRIPPEEPEGHRRKVPHIGWAPLRMDESRQWGDSVLRHVKPGDSVYFVHSFSARPHDPADSLAHVDFEGFPVCAAVMRDNLFGVQFHPEKSGPVGLTILDAFLDL